MDKLLKIFKYSNFKIIKGSGVFLFDDGRKKYLDFSAGIKFHKKIGNYVEKNEIVMEYFCSNKASFEKCKLELDKTFNVQIEKQSLMKLIYK